MALGEQLLLEPLEPPVRLVEEPAELGERASDRDDLAAEPFLHGRADPVGQPGSSSSAARASASTCSRERSSAASKRAESARPARPSAMRRFARSRACSSMKRKDTVAGG